MHSMDFYFSNLYMHEFINFEIMGVIINLMFIV